MCIRDSCITGNDILHPYGQPNVPQFSEEEMVGGRKKRLFSVAQNKISSFWTTWLKNIPPQLVEKSPWFHTRDNLQVGDFVIILEPGLKRSTAPLSVWSKAVVTKTHPSADGLVRSVTVRDSKRDEYVRPIHKLCLIATKEELEA